MLQIQLSSSHSNITRLFYIYIYTLYIKNKSGELSDILFQLLLLQMM